MNSKADFIDRFQTKGHCAAFGEVCYDQCLKDELSFSATQSTCLKGCYQTERRKAGLPTYRLYA